MQLIEYGLDNFETQLRHSKERRYVSLIIYIYIFFLCALMGRRLSMSVRGAWELAYPHSLTCLYTSQLFPSFIIAH